MHGREADDTWQEEEIVSREFVWDKKEKRMLYTRGTLQVKNEVKISWIYSNLWHIPTTLLGNDVYVR